MSKLEFINWMQDYKNSIGLWTIEPSRESFAQYTIGCFKDCSTGEYKVYVNNERSHSIRYITQNQDEAYDKLKNRVLFIVENPRGY